MPPPIVERGKLEERKEKEFELYGSWWILWSPIHEW